MAEHNEDLGYVEATMTSGEYEKLTQTLYQLLIKSDGFDNIEVKHNTSVMGKSGAKHQIDVYWEHRIAGKKYLTFIECKHFKDAVSIGHIRNFRAVLEDTGATGIFVTKVGYQSGGLKYAKFYKIDTKIIKSTEEQDLNGHIRQITMNLHIKTISNLPHPEVSLKLADRDTLGNPLTDDFIAAINKLDPKEKQETLGAFTYFRDLSGKPDSERIGEMLPRLLPVLDLEPNVPQEKTIELFDNYLLIEGRLIQALKMTVKFQVNEFITTEKTDDALDIYNYILKDYESGKIEILHGPKGSKTIDDR